MNKKRVIFLMTMMVVVLFASVGLTYAWLTDKKDVGDAVFIVGDVKYEILGTNIKTTDIPVVPGQPLLINGGYKIRNGSTVDTELRAKITYNYVTGRVGDTPVLSTTDKVFDDKNTSTVLADYQNKELLGTIGDANNKWIFHDTDRAWYYVGASSTATKNNVGSSAGELKYPIAKSATGDWQDPFAFISSLKFNGLVVGNDWSGATITVSITIEAKQAMFVDWVVIGQFNFETGV
jgi:hypothetical protein